MHGNMGMLVESGTAASRLWLWLSLATDEVWSLVLTNWQSHCWWYPSSYGRSTFIFVELKPHSNVIAKHSPIPENCFICSATLPNSLPLEHCSSPRSSCAPSQPVPVANHHISGRYHVPAATKPAILIMTSQWDRLRPSRGQWPRSALQTYGCFTAFKYIRCTTKFKIFRHLRSFEAHHKIIFISQSAR